MLHTLAQPCLYHLSVQRSLGGALHHERLKAADNRFVRLSGARSLAIQFQLSHVSSKQSLFSIRPSLAHSVSPGTASATYRKSSVASFRYTCVAAEERWPKTSPIDFSETRSEEHTSELQSRPHLVCRLL